VKQKTGFYVRHKLTIFKYISLVSPKLSPQLVVTFFSSAEQHLLNSRESYVITFMKLWRHIIIIQIKHIWRERYIPTNQGIIYPSYRGGVQTFLTSLHRPPLEVLKSSYTYADRVYAILSYRRLLQ